jgi:pimeloyl-ACP methyl ester carboxylesterase
MNALTSREPGTPGRTAIVFLHGSGTTAAMRDDSMSRFGGQYHCLAPDLPGHGDNRVVSWKFLSDAADRVAALIESRAASGRAHVVGLSLGGRWHIFSLAQQPRESSGPDLHARAVRAWIEGTRLPDELRQEIDDWASTRSGRRFSRPRGTNRRRSARPTHRIKPGMRPQSCMHWSHSLGSLRIRASRHARRTLWRSAMSRLPRRRCTEIDTTPPLSGGGLTQSTPQRR